MPSVFFRNLLEISQPQRLTAPIILRAHTPGIHSSSSTSHHQTQPSQAGFFFSPGCQIPSRRCPASLSYGPAVLHAIKAVIRPQTGAEKSGSIAAGNLQNRQNKGCLKASLSCFLCTALLNKKCRKMYDLHNNIAIFWLLNLVNFPSMCYHDNTWTLGHCPQFRVDSPGFRPNTGTQFEKIEQ